MHSKKVKNAGNKLKGGIQRNTFQIGIVKVIKEYYPDHTDKKNIFGMVDLVAVKKLNEFVTLDQIKSTKELLNMPLVKQSRLSVSPVKKAEWETILKLGKTTI